MRGDRPPAQLVGNVYPTQPRLNVTIGSVKQKKLGADALLDFNLRITLGDETLTERELQALLAAREGLVAGPLVPYW